MTGGSTRGAELRVAILTVSTSRAASGEHDASGERLAQFALEIGGEVYAREIVPDDRTLIEDRLRHFSDVDSCALVLTTGGTGVAPRDLTPEATRAVIEREVPGIAEAMRDASRPHTRHWMLSRGLAGIRGRSLIVNFPGNPRSIAETAAAIADALPHALALIADRPTEH
jgi:molybdopterin adenylyltransferase